MIETFLLIFFSVFSFARFSTDEGETYAILVAGAKDWKNYWSQAQVCAAYQQLHAAGIPDSNIIVWQYDDLAHNPLNPHKGKVFWPNKKGKDVYEGCPKDLTGKAITPENFMKLLRGEEIGKKRLNTTGKDRLFIYFSDHGGDGVIFFPGFVAMHAADLIDSLKFMVDHNMFEKMVFYLDTCHSGSMFNSLLDPTWNIYAATSVDPLHVAWLCDCNDLPIIGHCSSNCWPKYYIEDTNEAMGNGSFTTRTFESQYWDIKNETYTTKSQTACRYGNMDIAMNPLNMFLGMGKEYSQVNFGVKINKKEDSIKMSDVTYEYYKRRHAIIESSKTFHELNKYELYMTKMDEKWKFFLRKLNLKYSLNDPIYECNPEPVRPKCLKNIFEHAEKVCGKFDEYSMKYISYLKHACNVMSVTVEEIKNGLTEICN